MQYSMDQISIYCMYACMYIYVLYVNCTEQYCWWKNICLFPTNYFLTATTLTPSTGKVSEHGSPDSHFCLCDCSIIVKTVVNSLEFKVIHFFFYSLAKLCSVYFPQSPSLFPISWKLWWYKLFVHLTYLFQCHREQCWSWRWLACALAWLVCQHSVSSGHVVCDNHDISFIE